MANKVLAALQPYMDSYYADNARKLHRTVDKILSRFGGLSHKDTDDFYSLANKVFADILKRYNPEQSFDGFLYSCLSNKIMTEITKRNREKRKADRMCTSLDTPVGDDDGMTIGNIIADDFDTFEEATKGQESGKYQDKVQQYISKLSTRQINILNFLIDGYAPCEIRAMLEISANDYAVDMQFMRSYENVKILF